MAKGKRRKPKKGRLSLGTHTEERIGDFPVIGIGDNRFVQLDESIMVSLDEFNANRQVYINEYGGKRRLGAKTSWEIDRMPVMKEGGNFFIVFRDEKHYLEKAGMLGKMPLFEVLGRTFVEFKGKLVEFERTDNKTSDGLEIIRLGGRRSYCLLDERGRIIEIFDTGRKKWGKIIVRAVVHGEERFYIVLEGEKFERLKEGQVERIE